MIPQHDFNITFFIVNVIYLVADGTIDEIIWPMIVRKIRTVTTALDGEAKTLKADFSERPSANGDTPASSGALGDGASAGPQQSFPKGDLRAWLASQSTSRETPRTEAEKPVMSSSVHCMECGGEYDSNGARAMVSCSSCGKYVHLDCHGLVLCKTHEACLHHEKEDTHITCFVCKECSLSQSSPCHSAAVPMIDLSQSDEEKQSSADGLPLQQDHKSSNALEPSPDEIEEFEEGAGPKAEDLETKSIGLYFKVSAHTGRIFIYDSSKQFMQSTCTAADVLSNDFSFLPSALSGSVGAVEEVKKFVSSWRLLKASERRLLASEFLQPPLQPHVRRLRLKRGAADLTPSFERYLPKLRGVGTSSSNSKRTMFTLSSGKAPSQQTKLTRKLVCGHCQQPLKDELVKFGVKYCCLSCAQSHSVKLNSSSIRRQIFELGMASILVEFQACVTYSRDFSQSMECVRSATLTAMNCSRSLKL